MMGETRHPALLLTGVPGVGKTTLIRRVAGALGGRSLGGFWTEEIRAHGRRLGFRLRGCVGHERIIAHVDFAKTRRVGKYGVDVGAIDEAASSALRPAPERDLYLVDEIGKMECLSLTFVAAMEALLDGDKPVVATIGLTGGGFIARVKAREDCLLWEVTAENRDRMPERVLAWLEQEWGIVRAD